MISGGCCTETSPMLRKAVSEVRISCAASAVKRSHPVNEACRLKMQVNRDAATNATDFTVRYVAACVHPLGEARVRRKLLRCRFVASWR